MDVPSGITVAIAAMASAALVIALNVSIGGRNGSIVGADLVAERPLPSPTVQPNARPSEGARVTLAPLPGIDVHVNDRAGYLFSYPDDWKLSSSGNGDELTDPNGGVVMSFDAAPSGPLRRAADQVISTLGTRYADVRVVSDRLETTDQGQPSSVIGATAVDESGALIRLMVITVHGPDRNRAITVRFARGSDPLDALPEIQQILASFRTSVAA